MKSAVFAVLFILLSLVVAEEDNRYKCTSTYSGAICYPVDCCDKFVLCEKGKIYPPQVSHYALNTTFLDCSCQYKV